MNKNSTLIIGSGQCGNRLAANYVKKYGYEPGNLVLFNTNVDDKYENLIKLQDSTGQSHGSGRNPLTTLETILPKNHNKIKKEIIPKLDSGNADTIILFNSTGGGSGSAINYYILTEMLIPYTNKEIRMYLVPVLGFKHEGNPINSNTLAVMNMYFKLTKDITIVPVDNDVVYTKGKSSTFDITNDNICGSIRKVLDFEYFVGTPKKNGVGTLDKKEFYRITGPSAGFLSYTEFDAGSVDDFESMVNPISKYDVKTAKNIIIMFKTKKNESVDLGILSNFKDMFPTQLRIVAESMAEDESKIEVIVNGLDVSQTYEADASNVISDVIAIKETRRESGKTNRKQLKVGNRRSLFNV